MRTKGVVMPKTVMVLTVIKKLLTLREDQKLLLDLDVLDVDVCGVLVLAACELQQTLNAV